jgi:hypothetical protein
MFDEGKSRLRIFTVTDYYGQIDELKNYFEYPEDEEVDGTSDDPYETGQSPELLLISQNGPRNREELLSLLPDKTVADRLLMRYFSSNSPSQREYPLLH